MDHTPSEDERKQAAEARRNSSDPHIRELEQTLQAAVTALNQALGRSVAYMPATENSRPMLYLIPIPDAPERKRMCIEWTR